MSHTLSIDPPPFSRRGACPSLEEPMQTGDGLLARLRIAGGRLTAKQLHSIATFAEQYGNGLIEVTARGNLQVRGLSESTRGAFATAVKAIVTVEEGLVVETPPLAGDDPTELADPRPLAAAIRSLAEPFSTRLGPKVSVVVDGLGQIRLGQLKADIRLEALGSSQWAFSFGGSAGEVLAQQEALERTRLALMQLATLGPQARAPDLAGSLRNQRQVRPAVGIGTFALHAGSATGLALPFGSASAPALGALCRIAHENGVNEFRLAPQHGLLAVDARPDFLEKASELGFVTSQTDPRLRVSACIGSDGCRSGHIAARTIGEGLAFLVKPGEHLHVSGCPKGCAHPRRADVTVVGRADGHGLVFSGTAGDTPQAVLRADQLESALAAR